jgi:hypothetical protein
VASQWSHTPIRIHRSTQRHCTALPYPYRRAAVRRQADAMMMMMSEHSFTAEHGSGTIHSSMCQQKRINAYQGTYTPYGTPIAAARRQPGHCGGCPLVCCFFCVRACDPRSWTGLALLIMGTIFFTPLVTHGSRWCCHMRAEQKDCRPAGFGSEVKSWRCAMDSTARKGDTPFGSTAVFRCRIQGASNYCATL